jgi:hypothetical protein
MTEVVAHVDPFRLEFPVHQQLLRTYIIWAFFLYSEQEFETCYEVPSGGRSFKRKRVVRHLQYNQPVR